MTDLPALVSYGVAGLSAIMLVLSARIIQSEQRRPHPRRSILRFTGFFMAFALVLAGINVYVQLREDRSTTSAREEAQAEMNALRAQSTACALAISKLTATIRGKAIIELQSEQPHRPTVEAIVRQLERDSADASHACDSLQMAASNSY